MTPVILVLAASVGISSATFTLDGAPAPSAIFASTDVATVVRLRNGTGRPLAGQLVVACAEAGLDTRQQLKVAANATEEVAVSWRSPAVAEITPLTLQVSFVAPHERFETALAYNVYPETPAMLAQARGLSLALYDPKGNAGVLFDYLDLWPTRLAVLDDLTGVDVLILGEDAAGLEWMRSPERVELLSGFIEQGGAVLILPQERPPAFLAAASSPVAASAESVYVLADRNVLFRGMRDTDWKHWGDSVARGGYAPTARVGERVYLADEEGRMLAGEYERGKGVAVVCQLDLIRHIRQAPPARHLFRSLFERCIERERPQRLVGLYDDEASGTAALLDEVGVAHTRLYDATMPYQYELVIVDAAAATRVPIQELRPRIAFGCHVLVLGATEGSGPFCTELGGYPIHCVAEPMSKLEVEFGYRTVQGIPRGVLDWGDRIIAAAGAICRSPHAKPLLVNVDPRHRIAGLLELPIGQGDLTISTLNLAGEHTEYTKHAARVILARVLTNLNAAHAAPVAQ